MAGVGTGGTLCGTGRRLKELNPRWRSWPSNRPPRPCCRAVCRGPQDSGIGAGFVPGNYDPQVVDRIVTVGDEEAIGTSRLLAAREGLLSGISAGAAAWAALQLARREEYRDRTIVVLLPDTGERYLSTELYDFDAHKTTFTSDKPWNHVHKPRGCGSLPTG